MTDKKNLPAKASVQNIAATTAQRGGLVARGLAAVKDNIERAQHQDDDARYRKARIVYDRVLTNCWYFGEPRSYEQITALSEAHKIFHQLADAGYGKSYYPLSRLLLRVTLVVDHNSAVKNLIIAGVLEKQAFDWCFTNQLQNDSDIWNDLGNLYLSEGAGEKNESLAFYWQRKAAGQGNIEAQCSLGWTFENGFGGVAQNFEQAAFWYRKASEQGNDNCHRKQSGSETHFGWTARLDRRLFHFHFVRWIHRTSPTVLRNSQRMIFLVSGLRNVRLRLWRFIDGWNRDFQFSVRLIPAPILDGHGTPHVFVVRHEIYPAFFGKRDQACKV